MRGAGRFLLLAFLFSLAVSATAQVQPVRPGQQTFIRRAVFANGVLWMLSDAGQLFTVMEGGHSAVAVASPQPVLDLWRQDGKALIAACSDAACNSWAVRHWEGARFFDDATVSTGGEHLVAVGGADETVFLLTPNRLVELRGGKAVERALASPLKPAPVAAALFFGRGVYLGFNAGEWGGGLKFIDRASGAISTIEKNTSKDLCGGPLNTNCDPVTGLAVLPWKPNCIAAAIGLVHMSPHGRIVEVCGADVSRIYFKPYGEQPARARLDDGEPFSTVAFFGMEAKERNLWAVGIDGVYRIAKDGAQSRSLPRFQKIDGFSISFSDPDVIMVMTDVNQRMSLSGSVPMLVPR